MFENLLHTNIYEIFFVHTYVTYENVFMAEPMLHTKI